MARRSLTSLLDEAQHIGVVHHVRARPTGEPVAVALPPLPTGRHMIAHFPIREEPAEAHWDATSYESVTPWICEFRDVTVHSSAGIVRIGTEVVADTLRHTNAGLNHYEAVGDGIRLNARAPAARLDGTCLSLLGGNHDNYYHWTMDCLARLAAIDAAALAECGPILVPPLGQAFQAAGLDLTGLARTHDIRTVAPDEAVDVERMLVPWTLTDDVRPHPCLRGFFDGLGAGADGPWPRRIYVDRRGAVNRRLANEDEVVQALGRLGFVPVRLETLDLAGQIGLFRNAEAIVAPHGAGLANIVFAPAGAKLVELHMDQYLNWCFRRLAAACNVAYDCVLGRAFPAPPDHSVHARPWVVSVLHVQAAVEQALAGA